VRRTRRSLPLLLQRAPALAETEQKKTSTPLIALVPDFVPSSPPSSSVFFAAGPSPDQLAAQGSPAFPFFFPHDLPPTRDSHRGLYQHTFSRSLARMCHALPLTNRCH
jgi:hypothetical protein